MKRVTLLIIVALMAALTMGSLLLAAKPVLAANCALVNDPDICDLVSATECTVNSPHTLTIAAGGSLTCAVDRDLRITKDGAIVVSVPDNGAVRTLNLNITNTGGGTGALTMESGAPGATISGNAGGAGIQNRKAATLNISATGKVVLQGTAAQITADSLVSNCNGGHGGIVNLTTSFTPANVSDLSIWVQAGAKITANGIDVDPGPGGSPCPAGDIFITATHGRISIDGLVEAAVDTGSTGNGRREDGGSIFIKAACDLDVTGKVSSRGKDNGADLVHLEGGCAVTILGLVESTGTGHITNPLNSCIAPFRPGKPSNSTACVEVWAGDSLTIDISNNPNAEINADTGASPGGSSGTSWIDLFARGNITILNSTSAWAVHANGNAGTDNGGVVTVKSAGTGPIASPGKIFLTGLALQASAAAHGQGGTVDVEGMFDVDLRAIGSNPDGSIQAKGGNGAPGDHGGHIIILSQKDIRAGTGSDLNVTGNKNSDPDDGTVVLQVCAVNVIDFPPGGGPGTITPADAIVTRTVGPCPPLVTFPTLAAGQYDVVLPICGCLPCVIELCGGQLCGD